MIDSEDIINSITDYLQEEEGGVSRVNRAINASNASKGDTLLPNVSNDVILSQRTQEVNSFTNGRLGLDIMGEGKIIPNYDTVAKEYTVELSYTIRDDFSSKVFLRALRMEGVITTLMQDYFNSKQEAGFMRGEISSTFTPERVLLSGPDYKAIKSGVVYNFLIF